MVNPIYRTGREEDEDEEEGQGMYSAKNDCSSMYQGGCGGCGNC